MLGFILGKSQRLFCGTASLGLVALCSACGGTLAFRGAVPIAVQGTPPAPPPKRVEVTEDEIKITEKVQFAYDDATILPQSFSLLDEVAATIKENPQLEKIEVGGHASTDGDDQHNLELSKRRAESVLKYLVDTRGVKETRLTSAGYGETKPLVTPESSEADREKNRRVQFVILERGEKPEEPRAEASN